MTQDNNQNGAPNQPSSNSEEEPQSLTWAQLDALREAGELPDFKPGMVVTDIPDVATFEHLQQLLVGNMKDRYLPDGRKYSTLGNPSIETAIDKAVAEQHIYSRLVNFRAVVMEADPLHKAKMPGLIDGEDVPNLTVIFMADTFTGGIALVHEAVMVMRTYGVANAGGPTAQAAIAKGDMPGLTVLARTRRIPSYQIERIQAASREMGHYATAMAVANAFSAGLPSLGKRRAPGPLEYVENKDEPLPDYEDEA